MAGAAGASILLGSASALLALPADAATNRVRVQDPPLRLVGIPNQQSTRIDPGPRRPDTAPLAAAGDFNGDGLGDVVVGSPRESPRGRRGAGAAYVVFGRARVGAVDVNRLGAGGLRIDGAPPALPVELDDVGPAGERVGTSVAGVGDVNRDGFDDVAVGVPFSSAGGIPLAGAAYVVYGGRQGGPIDLAELGARGFRIDGTAPSAFAGTHIAAAGEVNGDGRPDIALSGTKGAWVAFGPGAPALTLVTPTPERPGEGPDDFPISAAGDANGDGLGDVAIGAPGLEPRGRYRAGAAYVVFGRPAGGVVQLSRMGSNGYRIDGEDVSGGTGESVAHAGDVNGDGRSDVVVGAPDWGRDGSDETFDAGAGYVVFGRSAPGRVDLQRLGAGGISIYSDQEEVDAQLGESVAGLGDLDRDGRPEVALGAPGLNGDCRRDTGAVYVVEGRRAPGKLLLGRLGSRGLRLDGARRDAVLGERIDALGDATGDRRPDLLIGTAAPEEGGRTAAPVVAPVPARRRARRAVPASSCLRVTMVSRRIATILRRRAIRFRITVREVPPGGTTLLVDAFVARGETVEDEDVLAGDQVSFRRPGTRTISLRLARGARRALRGRGRVRVYASGRQGLGDDELRYSVTRHVLRR